MQRAKKLVNVLKLDHPLPTEENPDRRAAAAAAAKTATRAKPWASVLSRKS